MSKVKVIEGPGSHEKTGSEDVASNDDARRNVHINRGSGEKIGLKKPVKAVSKLKALRKAEGYTLEHLSRLTDISPSYLSRLEAGDRRLNTDLIQRLADVFRCSPADLLQDSGSQSSAALSGSSLLSSKYNQFQKDLPIYKIGSVQEVGNIPVAGEHSESPIQYLYLEDPIDWAYRPVQLTQVPSAFAVYLSKPQFSPKYDEGELLLVHPSKPLSKGCAVLVINRDDSVILGQFEGWESETLMLTSYSTYPEIPRELNLKKSNLKALYRIIGTLESP